MDQFKKRNILGIFIIILCFACNDYTGQKETPKTTEAVELSKATSLEKSRENETWLHYFNIKSDSLKYLYAPDAIKILSDGTVLNGREQIKDYLLKGAVKFLSIRTDKLILANKKRVIEYELSESLSKDSIRYKNVVIWQSNKSERKRIFEFVEKVGSSDGNFDAIDRRRALWMQLCNKHDAEKLIKELYTENTLYFNHKPMVKGQEQLIAEYQYMNDENYGLSLHPITIEQVNKHVIVEMGQCSRSYKGKYIIIWKKEQDGEWRVFIDSNI